MKAIKLTFLTVLIASAFYLGSQSGALSTIEREKPKLINSHIPKSFGSGTTPLLLTLADTGAGLSSVKIYIKQAENSHVVYEEKFAKAISQTTVETQVEGLPKSLTEGAAKVVIEVDDASLWANRFQQRSAISLDFSKPQLNVMSQQHIAHQGGTEFVLLEALDNNLKNVGVQVGPYTFAGVDGTVLDPALANRNIYGVLLALPLEIENPTPQAFAEDFAGNRTEIALSFPINDFRQASTKPLISKHFINRKVAPLFEEYLSQEKLPASTDDEISMFKAVNQDYRAKLQQRLAELPLSVRSVFREAFVKPMASATTSNFGELRSYSFEGKEAGGSRHDGLDLASVLRDKVVASEAGTVVLAEPFGIYGTAVVIDHGMGLTSLYGHLSSLNVASGDPVNKGQEIGRSGETGLAGGDHLHFEFRVGQVPVNPKEWWDQHWIDDNISGKIDALKEALGVS